MHRLLGSASLFAACLLLGGCNSKGDSPSPPRGGERIDWAIAGMLLDEQVQLHDQLERDLRGRACDDQGFPTGKTVKQELIDRNAYSREGRLFDPDGRELRFMNSWSRQLVKEDRDRWLDKKRKLEQQYRVIVVENPVKGID
jgi:hypothetical protein